MRKTQAIFLLPRPNGFQCLRNRSLVPKTLETTALNRNNYKPQVPGPPKDGLECCPSNGSVLPLLDNEQPISRHYRLMPRLQGPLLPGSCGSPGDFPARSFLAAAVGHGTTTPGGRRRRRRVVVARWSRVQTACRRSAVAAARRGFGGPCGRRATPASWPKKVTQERPGDDAGTAALLPHPPP